MKTFWIALVGLLMLALPAAGEEAEIVLGPFVVSQPEGWRLASDETGMGGSLEYGRMDACVYMSVTDLSREVSALPVLTALGEESVLKLFARSTFACEEEEMTLFEVDGCRAVRTLGTFYGVRAACAALIKDRQVLSLVGSDISAGLGREAVLELALSHVRASTSTSASGVRADYACGIFTLPCPGGAAWHTLEPDTGYLLFDDSLATVSAQYEILEGADIPQMIDALGLEYYMESAAKYFGGRGIVEGGEMTQLCQDTLCLRMRLNAPALLSQMLGTEPEAFRLQTGFDLSACSAQGALLIRDGCTATLISISASRDRSAPDILDAILQAVACPQAPAP